MLQDVKQMNGPKIHLVPFTNHFSEICFFTDFFFVFQKLSKNDTKLLFPIFEINEKFVLKSNQKYCR